MAILEIYGLSELKSACRRAFKGIGISGARVRYNSKCPGIMFSRRAARVKDESHLKRTERDITDQLRIRFALL